MNTVEPHSFSWHTSSYSPSGGGNCVEVGERASPPNPTLDDLSRFAVRDSTQRERGFLSFGRTEWGAFLRSVKQERI